MPHSEIEKTTEIEIPNNNNDSHNTKTSKTDTMSPPQVNGEKANTSSAFLSHLISYPLISDSIHTITSTPLGSKSISLSQQTYATISQPLLPLLRTPLAYITPYAQRADKLADNGLSTLDSKFPVVKKPTGELYSEGKSIVFYPLKKGTEGRDYVLNVYGSEVKKVGGEGIVAHSKAAISTGLVVSSEALGWLSAFLSQKKKEAKEVGEKAVN